MLKVGIMGFGGLGQVHLRCWQKRGDVRVVAVCDVEESKWKAAGATAINISGSTLSPELGDIEFYTDFGRMLAQSRLDAVSIALPTFLHAEYSVQALEAGVHVLCEKPMALNSEQCQAMVEAAKRSGKVLQIGHCIRFWPEYVRAREMVRSGEYGRLRAGTFGRLAARPQWSWNNWMAKGSQSGGAVLDLHIHDSDYVQFLLGLPKAVFSRGVRQYSGDLDHIVTQYIYDDDKVIMAEGGWMMGRGFGFVMKFQLVLDGATVVYDSSQKPAMRVYPAEGEAVNPEIPAGDAYSLQIDHFVESLQGRNGEAVLTPEDSRNSVRLIERERESALTGKVIRL